MRLTVASPQHLEGSVTVSGAKNSATRGLGRRHAAIQLYCSPPHHVPSCRQTALARERATQEARHSLAGSGRIVQRANPTRPEDRR
jgi:hypothetical protein